LGWREGNGPYQWLTYKQVAARAQRVGSGLLALGFKPHDFVGIYSRNKLEWVLTEQACNAYSMVVIPLYDTLGNEAVEWILTETQLRIIFCTADKIKNLVANFERCPELRTVVVIDELQDTHKVQAQFDEYKVRLLTFAELEQMGEESLQEVIPPNPDDLATICYTSGTTGRPKGAMLTHGNFIADAAGILKLNPVFTKNDVCISYLPLAHVFERIVQTGIFGSGASTGFFRGTVQELFDDIALLRPTVFPSVPRVYNRLYDKVMAQRASMKGIKKTLFEMAWENKKALLKQGIVKSPLWDRLVFSKVAARLGGRVHTMITGAAPLSADVKDFIRICFSCELLEGYGQTECCAAACVTLFGDTSSGHVGCPVPSCEIKLVDVPEMEYHATDKPYPRGEICYRGPIVFQGYYKNQENTDEVLDEDGWLHSGDIGTITDKGTFKIIDRKKNIFKLAQGEYIAPDKLEDAYGKSPFVGQIFVYGESLKASLVAIIVPDPEVLLPWAKEKNISGDLAELCQSDKVKSAIMASLTSAAETAQLKGFERIADIYLDHVPFSVDNDLLTPTFKLRRPQAYKHYCNQIQAMYQHLE
jgi:long-chain acyl-CoA synthetase